MGEVERGKGEVRSMYSVCPPGLQGGVHRGMRNPSVGCCSLYYCDQSYI